MKCLLAIFFTVSTIAAFSQTVQNVVGIQVDKRALVSYDLLNADSILHQVALFYSTDGGKTFSSELKRTAGDVGRNVVAGRDLKINWDVEAELGYLKSDVVFKVTAAPIGVKAKANAKSRIFISGYATGFRAEVNGFQKEGAEIQIFARIVSLTNNVRNSVSKSCTVLTSTAGKSYPPDTGKLGNVSLDETSYFVKGADMPLKLTFKIPDALPEFMDLTVCLGGTIMIKVKNIPTR